MTNAFPHPSFPLEVTAAEARAGFERLDLYRLVDRESQDQWTPVVGKVLSSSDILVKSVGFFAPIVYCHKRFGTVFKLRPTGPEWHQMGNEHLTVDKAIIWIDLGATEEDGPSVDPVAAEIRRPEQDVSGNGV